MFGKSLYFLVAVLAVHLITAHRPGGRPGGPGGPGRDDGDDGQDRYKQIVRCNYTETPGKTCLSCNETLACSRLNLGVIVACRKHKPHCNRGVCSITASASCNSTSTQ